MIFGRDTPRRSDLMLKSRVHWRAGFGSIAKDVVECAGTGVCTSNYSMLTFRKVRRPIFPLDPINDRLEKSQRRFKDRRISEL
jgi:microcystin degradation protein MlrC